MTCHSHTHEFLIPLLAQRVILLHLLNLFYNLFYFLLIYFYFFYILPSYYIIAQTHTYFYYSNIIIIITKQKLIKQTKSMKIVRKKDSYEYKCHNSYLSYFNICYIIIYFAYYYNKKKQPQTHTLSQRKVKGYMIIV